MDGVWTERRPGRKVIRRDAWDPEEKLAKPQKEFNYIRTAENLIYFQKG